ncbi:hypothetical protein ACFV1W_10770 [Kitasatospora sp. NPDC059648]|uniref:hypothetical protein n=1 Tax=Kitasatospora sp. NPDC059648 TaxID=3346894 RepID=UPI0036BE447C
MVDTAHLIPRSPDDPPPSPSRWRRALPWLGGVLALTVVVGGGLWVWKPWRSQELPQSACWSALSKDDLKPLAGKYGKATQQGAARLQTPAVPDDPANRSDTCFLDWYPDGGDGSRTFLSVQVDPALDGIDADRAKASAGGRPVATLDFGSGAAGLATTETSQRVQLYVRCDFQAPQGLKATPYVRIDVGGNLMDGASPAKARQAYADIALKIARVAATEYKCGNQVQLPATAPAVPELSKS